jgi:hypothetical protein
VSETPSLIAAARGVGDLIEERFREVEAHVGALLTRMSDLELECKATLRRVEMLERRIVRAESKLGGSGEAESGS